MDNLFRRLKEWWRNPYRERPNWTDKAVVALTIGIVAMAGMQWWEMHTGGIDTKAIADAAKQQACAAKSFAANADKINTGIGNAVLRLGQQADDAETFFRTDERAWVVVDQVVLLESYPPRDNFPWSFKYGVYVKNAGKTIARDVRIHITPFFGATQLNKHGIEMTQGRTWGGWKGKDLTPEQAGPHS